VKVRFFNLSEPGHRAIDYLGYHQQQHLIEVARQRTRQRARYWVTALGFLLPSVTICILAPLGTVTGWLPVGVAVGFLLPAQVWLLWAWPQRARRLFLDELRVVLLAEGIRPAVCLVCGYDLRGCPSDRCPECGASLAMASVVAPPRPPE
jgi:hypothetical protein